MPDGTRYCSPHYPSRVQIPPHEPCSSEKYWRLRHDTEIAHISNPDVPHYQYFALNAHSYLRALDQLETYLAIHGPFDGVLGFSQGAEFALMYLIRHIHIYPGEPLPFKVCVLLSRIGVYDPACWLDTGRAVSLVEMPKGLSKIRIPVAAVWGEKDWEITKNESLATSGLIDEEFIWAFVHGGGHEIPGPSINGSVSGAVKVIRRAVTQAQMV